MVCVRLIFRNWLEFVILIQFLFQWKSLPYKQNKQNGGNWDFNKPWSRLICIQFQRLDTFLERSRRVLHAGFRIFQKWCHLGHFQASSKSQIQWFKVEPRNFRNFQCLDLGHKTAKLDFESMFKRFLAQNYPI